ncbi:copine, putative [Entamoeba histolytica HM-1:IMSS-B]|uniref:Copine, putative n=8 Tax=Entamoeba TaxID=5758 RepID=C4MBJ7_ENTH1|nr:copine, putative [Entamoeba nuttalli P19]XP_647967.1 copine, putative [Entamoeba histolytica HM-1:IMSS]EMD43427.1 copine, putative [Entamoeba histolytica KU27]EMH72343.1 copine, putative [Entamoeba histolytica HM-1:IMSS-B]EMS14285.1 copine, putative [Entamoeba histolytica HM-3:IMSS]ENY63871.1 copine, putative [Entamoeba histolytica HM-1:IMSS-A]GAT99396.1 copine putative [Entamoeba histolytica]|eukprot:XP_008860789.1 copine, putative [Entamoeba nuttalli P19]
MGNEQATPQKRLTDPIMTTYETLEDLQTALTKAGLESSNLIVGIDFTGSNASSGKKTYGRNMHTIDPSNPNPYMRVMDIMGRALAPYDDDGLIPVFGFGDKRTQGKAVFDLSPENKPFLGMAAAIEQYKKTVPSLTLSGPTSFAPLIKKAIEIVKETKQYHILVIICDGQVSDVDVNRKAIEEASKYPISIICVGVGDGPFGVMENFDDVVKNAKFDNFNFVNYYKVCEGHVENPDVAFACAAMNEIPEQYAIMKQLGYFDN